MDDLEDNSFSGFKFDEYKSAVLFFNIIGTIAVFPVEIAMVYFRLASSQEEAIAFENWVSTGMLISIMLEDLPQLVLQAIYFSVVSDNPLPLSPSPPSRLCSIALPLLKWGVGR